MSENEAPQNVAQIEGAFSEGRFRLEGPGIEKGEPYLLFVEVGKSVEIWSGLGGREFAFDQASYVRVFSVAEILEHGEIPCFRNPGCTTPPPPPSLAGPTRWCLVAAPDEEPRMDEETAGAWPPSESVESEPNQEVAG